MLSCIHSLLDKIFHCWLSLSIPVWLVIASSNFFSPREDEETTKLIICVFHHKQPELKTLCRLPIKDLYGSSDQKKKRCTSGALGRKLYLIATRGFPCEPGSYGTCRCNFMSAWKSPLLPFPSFPLHWMPIKSAKLCFPLITTQGLHFPNVKIVMASVWVSAWYWQSDVYSHTCEEPCLTYLLSHSLCSMKH